MLQAFAIYLTCGALLYCSSGPGRRTELHEWEKAPVRQQIEGTGHFAIATDMWKSHAISTLEWALELHRHVPSCLPSCLIHTYIWVHKLPLSLESCGSTSPRTESSLLIIWEMALAVVKALTCKCYCCWLDRFALLHTIALVCRIKWGERTRHGSLWTANWI